MKIKILLGNNQYLIYIVLGLAFILRNYTMAKYGIGMTINSDDQGYINSAKDLLETGVFSYHQKGTPTVHIMPGFTILLATIFYFFGSADLGLYVTKTFMTLFGMASIYGIYLIGKYIYNVWTGLLSALIFSLSVPHIVTDNLVMTEAPFTACFIFFVYFSMLHAKFKLRKHFYYLLAFYVICLFLRPTVALMPFVLLIYYLTKKYPWKLMIRHATIAFITLILLLTPWWIRNYIHFNDFIPLSGSSGDPLLLGTFQGEGYPNNESYDDVIVRVKEVMPVQDAYYELKYEGIFAKERMRAWWETNPSSMIKSYLILKPISFWKDTFYWIPIFNITGDFVTFFQKISLGIGFSGLLISLFSLKSKRSEIFFIFLFIIYFTVINSYYFAYARYNLPLMPFVYLGASILISSSISYLKKFGVKLRSKSYAVDIEEGAK